ncbi:MAG TPA: carboxypeptidase-like regulatory domain-containing protein [Chloroflexia bacterium]|nr:carboxypeptidase-like regulatory domain-containing protein [Chloroflexia bacterium]
MKRFFMTLLAVAFLFGFGVQQTFAAPAGGTVSGKVIRWDGTPVAGATIRVLTGALESTTELARTTTAADGSYTVSLPLGQTCWVHVDTFGSWWGYSYAPAFTLRAGEAVSQVFFAIGPRDVKEIALPVPVSNIAPALGTNPAPHVAAQPVAVVAKSYIAQVKPLVGTNAAGAAPPITLVGALATTRPHTLPTTGAHAGDSLGLGFLAGLALLAAGLLTRRLRPVRA